MSDPVIFSILLALLLMLLAAGVWVAMALMVMAFAALVFFSNAPEGLVLATTLWGHSHSWPLAALPLFILMGEILLRSRLSQDMFSGLAPWLGRAPGRLLHVNILGCAIFAAVSGSSAATAATIGRMSVPELTKRGYTEVVRKATNPSWTPTANMRERNPSLPQRIAGGATGNPLGTRAMYLTWPAYLVHGTHDTRKIGRQSSSGCIGLYNQHVEELFELVQIGTQVRLV